MRLQALLLIGLLPALSQDVRVRAVEILNQHCGQCHGATAMGGVNFSTRAAAMASNALGTRLTQAVTHAGKIKMPPGKKLDAADIATLETWVASGAEWPASAVKAAGPVWWSFRKPIRPAVPVHPAATSPATSPIDAFILTGLAKNGLPPNGPAEREVLIRRAYYDLHGLPPAAARIDAFIKDTSPAAWTRLIEELLASPRYGEKWGRFWLDLVRYSDTSGFESDPYVADAWRYRDYVIKSLNDDKPYDRFVKEQLAGDEIYPEEVDAKIGTGFYCVGPNRDMNPEQAEINKEEVLTDFTDTTGAVFMGLAVGCARCHDHKYDPIPQRDYYAMRALFAPAVKTRIALGFLPSLAFDFAENKREIKFQELGDQIEAAQTRCRRALNKQKLALLPPEVEEAVNTPEAQRTAAQQQLFDANRKRIGISQDEVRACMNDAEKAGLAAVEKEFIGLFANYKPKPFACGIGDTGRESPHTYMPEHGVKPGKRVEAGLLTALGGGLISEPPIEATSSQRRKALAEWIANKDHPLTARVMVNRIWQQHFGSGLAQLASDFGARGQTPSHPELLDYLAAEFMDGNWSIKAMHRLMMNSDAYRRAAQPAAEAQKRDPQNTWYSHFTRRRLTAEEIRDSVLSAADALNLKAGGRPVITPLNKAEMYNFTKNSDDLWIVNANAEEHSRRSIYLFQRRTFRLPLMDAFDSPEPMLSCSRREASTSAPQSLTLLNSDFTMAQARRLGMHLAERYADDKELAQQAFRQVLGRQPRADEFAPALDLLGKQRTNLGNRPAAAAELCRGLMNLNEFLYID